MVTVAGAAKQPKVKEPLRIQPVIQQEATGCGIAAAAAIAGISYPQAKSQAACLGIAAEDRSLWSDPRPVCRLLAELGIATAAAPVPFRSWDRLPDCALLSIRWHLENNRPFWHWVVFVREVSGRGADQVTREYLLDSKKALKSNVRTDFGRIRPKWFIEVLR